jgi:hypothetical protein
LKELLGFANSNVAREILINIINENVIDLSNRNRLKAIVPISGYPLKSYVTSFREIMDEIAARNGKSLWVEKTPSHLHRIDLIEKHISDAKFLHMVRNGKDVVASLYKVTRDYPEVWDGSRTIETCVQRWNQDVKLSLKYREKVNHFFVQYKDLVADTERQSKNLCEFLDLEFYPEIYMYHDIGAKLVIENTQDWVKNVAGPIEDKNDTKFDMLFDEDEKNWIRNNLVDYELG